MLGQIIIGLYIIFVIGLMAIDFFRLVRESSQSGFGMGLFWDPKYEIQLFWNFILQKTITREKITKLSQGIDIRVPIIESKSLICAKNFPENEV